MSDIPRWNPDGNRIGMAESERGTFVTYADHVAAVQAEREAAERRLGHITELLNRQKITHAELIGPNHVVLIEVSRVEAAMKEDFDE